MAFVAETEIFTNSGWKPIKDIAGRDKVLVRNFIGDAEFIQPFSLRKSKYSGEIIQIGGNNWSFSVTPDHIVVYDRSDIPKGNNFKHVPAKDVKIHSDNRIYRKFRYVTPENYKKETIYTKDEFGKKYTTISNEDWFVLIAYVLERVQIVRSSKFRNRLSLRIDVERLNEEIELLGGILDRMGAKWTFVPSYTNGTGTIRVDAKNTLASRVATRMGSTKRKEMFLPNKMIYESSKELAKMFFDALISASKRAETQTGAVYQYQTNNKKLLDSLDLYGTIWGYGMSSHILARKGEDKGKGKLSKDVYNLIIQGVTKTYSPTFIEKRKYNDVVYKIDLFDGQVYVRDGGMPVWVNPK